MSPASQSADGQDPEGDSSESPVIETSVVEVEIGDESITVVSVTEVDISDDDLPLDDDLAFAIPDEDIAHAIGEDADSAVDWDEPLKTKGGLGVSNED